MADPKNTASSRLTQITDFLTMNKTATTIPWDPNSTKFPTRQELPDIPGAPKEAAWVWGNDDYVCLTLSINAYIYLRMPDWPPKPSHTNKSCCCSQRD